MPSVYARGETDRGRVRVAGSRGGSHLFLVPRRELQDAPHQLHVRGGIFGHHLPNPHAARARPILDVSWDLRVCHAHLDEGLLRDPNVPKVSNLWECDRVFNSSEIKNDSVRKQSGRKYNRLPYHTKPYICNIVTTNTHPNKFGKRYAVDLAPA